MPRVVSNQRERFENDELFRKLSRDMEVKYSGFRDRPLAERRLHFQSQCSDGHVSLAVIGVGLNLSLNFCWTNSTLHDAHLPTPEFVDFQREPNKVHLKSHFILNGVCVTWRGWVDLRRLDGVGRLEFDDERARVEDSLLTENEPTTAVYDISSVAHHHHRRHLQQQQQQPHHFVDHSHTVTSSVTNTDESNSALLLDYSNSSTSSSTSSDAAGRRRSDVAFDDISD